ncbi:MAG: acylphosphatase [Synergistaceae bacterium]|jgi:acylphosphatase|nr:acylphosphatase [Synergistaceae bacterium]
MKERVQKRVVFSGRVQHVGFRSSFRSRAQALGLDGWVSNLWDGRVEAVIAGPKEDVGEIIDWCRSGGIPLARVAGIEIQDEPPSPEHGFRIK